MADVHGVAKAAHDREKQEQEHEADKADCNVKDDALAKVLPGDNLLIVVTNHNTRKKENEGFGTEADRLPDVVDGDFTLRRYAELTLLSHV